jgi:uncharacterized protein YqgC (DUF456 family)
LVLLVGGVVGSVVPNVPGALLSMAGVLVYWGGTGFTDPGPIVLVGLLLLGLVTLAVDWLSGIVSAKVGGASTSTAIAAGLVGGVLFFVTGPLGIILGVGGTVFAIEYYRHRDFDESMHAASVTTVGMLGSALVQALLTAVMLVVMAAVWVL